MVNELYQAKIYTNFVERINTIQTIIKYQNDLT